MGADFLQDLYKQLQEKREKLLAKQVELSKASKIELDETRIRQITEEILLIRNQINEIEETISKLNASKFNQYLIQVGHELLRPENIKQSWTDIKVKNINSVSHTKLHNDSKLSDIYTQITSLLKDQSIDFDQIFSHYNFDRFDEGSSDLLGRESEQFSSDESNPNDSINQLALQILNPAQGEDILDICSGQGNFLAETFRKAPEANLFGQEIAPRNVLISNIRLYKLGAGNYTIKEGDAIKNPAFFDGDFFKQFDKVFSNFPFLMRIDDESINAVTKYWKTYPIELSKKNTADWLFIGTALNQLKEDGKVVAVMCSGPLFKQNDRDVRAKLVGDGMIEAIIHLPEDMLSYTRISTDMIILSHDNEAVKMIDASDICIQGRRVNEFSPENIDRILSLYHSNNESTVSRIVSREEIRINDFSLDPTRYLVYNRIKVHSPITLGDVAEKIFRGIQISADELDTINQPNPEIKHPYKLLNIGDVNFGEIAKDLPLAYVEPSKRFDRYCLENGDILLPAKGTKIKTAVADIDDEDRIIATGNIIVIRVKQHKINPYYLKAFLDSSTGQKLLRSVQTGTAMVSISPGQLEVMEISLLDQEKQDRIAKQFLVNRDMIKRTRQKLAALESEMETLYDHIIEEG